MKFITTRIFRYCPKTGKIVGLRPLEDRKHWMFPLIGIAASVWFLVRVIPKPTRAGYPCQRVALPLASSFLLWILGISASALALSRTKLKSTQRRFVNLAVCLAVMGLSFGMLDVNAKVLKAVEYTPHPANSPIGVARGLMPGRVVWAHNPQVTDWNGSASNASQSWFNHIDQAEATKLMQWALRGYAGTTTTTDAWIAIFHSFNDGSAGYEPGEKIYIKVNFVTTGGDTCADADYNWTPTSCGLSWTSVATSPQLMVALLDQLVNVVGVEEPDITIGDPCGKWVNEFYNIVHGVFPNVNYLDSRGTLGRTHAARSSTRLYWSTSEADGKNPDYLLQAVVDASYMINFAVLKSHERNGTTVSAKNHFGSLSGGEGDIRKPNTTGYYDIHLRLPLDNTVGAWPQRASMAQYRPIVDLNGHDGMGGKTLLYLIDGIFSGRGWGAAPSKWALTPFNDNWPSSLFLSMDEVAIDSVAFDFLSQQWPDHVLVNEGVQDYLHEMALANDPPSGTFYDPEDNSLPMTSQGVHEHWNNVVDKQYSRDLGNGDGIELIYLNPNLAPQVFGKSTPLEGSLDISTNPTLEWETSTNTESYQYCYDTTNNALCDGDSWQDNGTSTSVLLSGMDSETTYYWQVQAVNGTGTTSADSGNWWSFTTGASSTCITVSVVAGWNMTSVPVVADDMALGTLFQDVVAPAYYFTSSYQEVNLTDTLSNGVGYWMYFNEPHSYQICGDIIESNDITLNPGWNMIGPFDVPTTVSAITSTPAGILSPPLFGYGTTYLEATTLDPGEGYWAYVTEDGTLHIGTAESATGTPAIPTNNTCTLDYQVEIDVGDNGIDGDLLTIGQGPSANDDLNDWCGEARLPPKPPAGAFDARLVLPAMLDASKKDYRSSLSNPLEWRLEFQPGAGGYPFTFTWDNTVLPPGTWHLQDKFGGSLIDIDMTAQNNFILESDNYDALVIKHNAAVPLIPLYTPIINYEATAGTAQHFWYVAFAGWVPAYR